jgi:hypothetical protein
MSYLKPGTLCVLVGGCTENIGLIVEIIAYIGVVCIGIWPPGTDIYRIKKISGRSFPHPCNLEGLPASAKSPTCITGRDKLRPLVDPSNESEERETEVVDVRSRKRELVDCPY